jgi:hypothetical protein
MPSPTPTPIVCPPFEGGFTMGYWMTHTGLDVPARDPTYDNLPIFLGVLPNDGSPEELIDTELKARNVFIVAEASDLSVLMLKAQLLAAKLNGFKFPGFIDAYLPSGQTVGEVMAQADGILDDLARAIARDKAEIVNVSTLLDLANNNGETPVLQVGQPPECAISTATPAPTSLVAVAGGRAEPSTPPSSLPATGGEGWNATAGSQTAQLIAAIVALSMVAVSVHLSARRRA